MYARTVSSRTSSSSPFPRGAGKALSAMDFASCEYAEYRAFELIVPSVLRTLMISNAGPTTQGTSVGRVKDGEAVRRAWMTSTPGLRSSPVAMSGSFA
jgi:hypothetical protein